MWCFQRQLQSYMHQTSILPQVVFFQILKLLKLVIKNKLITGKCSPPCYDVVPGDPTGRCFVYSKDRECLCIDPCTLYSSKKLDPLYGSELKSSGDACERCVAHKSFTYFSDSGKSESPTRMNPTNRPKWVHTPPKGSKSFDISCGMCDTECVSGQATGPRMDGNECPGVWSWKLDHCRRMDLTEEAMATEEENGIAAAAADGSKTGGSEFETYRQDQQPDDTDKKKK